MVDKDLPWFFLSSSCQNIKNTIFADENGESKPTYSGFDDKEGIRCNSGTVPAAVSSITSLQKVTVSFI